MTVPIAILRMVPIQRYCQLMQVKLTLYFDNDTMFGPKSDPKSDPKSLTKRQMEIINLIQEKSGITREEIASILSLSESTIKREIATLKEMAILTREGGRYSGRWVVAENGGYPPTQTGDIRSPIL